MKTRLNPLFISFWLFTIWLPGFAFTQSSNKNQLDQWLDTLNLKEQLYLQTDRDVYISGNDLLFTAYNAALENDKPCFSSKIIYLALSNEENQIIATKMLRLHNRKTRGHLTIPDTVSTGIYQAIVFTSWMKNPGREGASAKELLVVNKFDQHFPSVFRGSDKQNDTIKTPAENNAAYFRKGRDNPLMVSTDSASYRTRGEINLEIGWDQIKGIDSVVSMSLRVVPKNALLPGHTTYSANVKPSTMPVLSGMRFIPEMEEYIFQGKLLDQTSGKPVTGKKILLAKPDSIVNGQYAPTGPQGNFYFKLNDYFLGDSIKLQVQDNTANKYDFAIAGKFTIKSSFTPKNIHITPATRDYITQSQEVAKINTIYGINHFNNSSSKKEENHHIYRIYREPDTRVVPDNYVHLENLPAIFSNIVSPVSLTQRDSVFTINIDNKNEHLMDLEFPSIFLDGIQIPYLYPIQQLDSDDIARIDVLSTPRYYGNAQYEGILAIYSNDKAIHNYPVQSNSKWITLKGFGGDQNYNPPDYAEMKDMKGFIPDFRQLLYWDPDVTLPEDQNITFYAGDLTGRYIARVTAITADGRIIESRETFQITKK